MPPPSGIGVWILSKIYVVGIGPGQYEQMTMRAADALRACDTIVGYTVYVELVREHFADKEFLTTPMRKEAERCRLAFEEAKKNTKRPTIIEFIIDPEEMVYPMIKPGGTLADMIMDC